MAGGVVDRAEWARVVQELLDAEIQVREWGAKTRLAGKIGVTTRTLDIWLSQGVDVKESSVRAAADKCGLDNMELLIRVGFYSREQMPLRLPDDVIDEEQQRVLDDKGLEDRVKAIILEKLEEMRADDQAILNQQAERDRRRRMERIDALREQYSRDPA